LRNERHLDTAGDGQIADSFVGARTTADRVTDLLLKSLRQQRRLADIKHALEEVDTPCFGLKLTPTNPRRLVFISGFAQDPRAVQR